jgi:hypothetical protein|uniref:DNA adenine methylase n=1 Tax=Mycobacteriaceae TaxID=1762 RepID=UPI000B2E3C45
MTPYQVGTNALSATALRPPFAYFGGKQKIAVDIAELLAGHSHYVEPYAGGLSVLQLSITMAVHSPEPDAT